MPKLLTRYFGEIEYDESRIINFPQGLPGFPDDKRFLFMSENDDEDTFFWLQSVDNGQAAFTLMNVYNVLPEYDPRVDEEEMAELGEIQGRALEIYNIVVIPDDVKEMRVNLMAPVVINMQAGIGKQILCTNDDYQIRYMIFDDLKRKEAGKKSC